MSELRIEHAVSCTAVVGLLLVLTAGICRAQQQHPVMEHGINTADAAGYENAVRRIMAMGEEEVLSFVPDKPIRTYGECPNCYGGVEGNGIFLWDIEKPDELKCRFCGTIIPSDKNGEDKYPEDKLLTGKNALGEEVSFPYYYSEEHKVSHFFSGVLSGHKTRWLESQLLALGKAYQATKKEEYAERALLILDKLAEYYPHYPVVQDHPTIFAFRESQLPPYPWDSGKWGHFHNEIPKNCILAYDMVYDSTAFETLSARLGHDVRAQIENDFFRAAFEAVAAKPDHINNVVGYDVASAAVLGRVIGEPRYVHWAFGWMVKNVEMGFMRDGMWKESPAYHYMTIGGLKAAFSAVAGYSDPPGYVDDVDGKRYDNLQPEAQVPFWGKCIDAPKVIDHPNGMSACVHDTHPYARSSQPRAATVSTILPGYGHASLGRGTGADQMQAQLHFSGGYGHQHLDNLNLTLWARGKEMLPDVGYTWTQMRYWATCTLGHNTVVVNRTDQSGGASDGDLLWFFPDSSGIGVVEADGVRGYRGIEGMQMYRRIVATVPVSDADAYVLDVFRVRGGTLHDWALHGDADEDTTAECSLPLSGSLPNLMIEGEQWVEPKIEGARFPMYGVVRDVASGETDDGFTVDFIYADEAERGMRLHMLPGIGTEVLLGRAPSVRRMGVGSRGDMRKAYDFWMPQLIVRRETPADATNLFAAIEEPWGERPFISGVEQVALEPADDDAVAMQVRHGAYVDTIISTLDEPPYPERVTADGVRFRGRLAVIRRSGETVTGAWMFEGASLVSGEFSMETDTPAYDGVLSGAQRIADGAEVDGFVTSANLPLGETLKGAWLIRTDGAGYTHGYGIARIERQGADTLIVLTDDPGVRIENGVTAETYFPGRKTEGENSFRIPLAASVVRENVR